MELSGAAVGGNVADVDDDDCVTDDDGDVDDDDDEDDEKDGDGDDDVADSIGGSVVCETLVGGACVGNGVVNIKPI